MNLEACSFKIKNIIKKSINNNKYKKRKKLKQAFPSHLGKEHLVKFGKF
jgi:hypothetical protein